MFKERERRPSRTKKTFLQTGGPPAGRLNRYQLPKGTKIEYKNLNLLQKYVTERGKIVPRRISGISAKQQRQLAVAIKRARFLGLLQAGVKKR